MEIIQEERNGIVCVIVKGRMEARLAQAFEKTIKEIIASDKRRLLFEVNRFKDTSTITDSVESGLKVLSCSLKAALSPFRLNQSRHHFGHILLNKKVLEIFFFIHIPFRYSRIINAALPPSPAALTTCLVLLSRTSPAAKMPGMLVSSSSGSRLS